jgi:hypothetical protein
MDPRLRRDYDRRRPTLIRRNELQQNDLGEQFARNAFSRNNGDDDADADDLNSNVPESMSPEKQQLVDKYTPEIKKLLDSDDQTAYNTLKTLSKKMEGLNTRENLSRATPIAIFDRCPPVDPIKRKGEKRRELLAVVNDPNRGWEAREDARKGLEDEQEKFYQYMEEQHIPLSGVYDITNTTVPPTNSQPSSARNRQTRDPRTAAGSSTYQSPSEPMDIDWIPGQTIWGEEILAHQGGKASGVMVGTVRSISLTA